MSECRVAAQPLRPFVVSLLTALDPEVSSVTVPSGLLVPGVLASAEGPVGGSQPVMVDLRAPGPQCWRGENSTVRHGMFHREGACGGSRRPSAARKWS